MKKVFTLLMIALFPILGMAQNSAIDQVFRKYEDREGFTVVNISKGLLKMAANFDDDKESQDFLSRIHEIKILAEETHKDGVNLYDEVLSNLDKKEYEELLTVKNSGQDVIILAKKDGNILEEIIILASGKEDNALVYISGKLNMKDLSKLSSSVNVDGAGLEHLKEVK
ncbi:MAG: DUF4252 domain-containing protein [Bacteroidales bacterium]|nr:DUF4252 domain-containing protein [Bacteroidales bacterium]